MENLIKSLTELKAASKILALLSTQEKNDSINLIADRLWARKELILQANQTDIEKANSSKRHRQRESCWYAASHVGPPDFG
jgi:gamma-glutamyl phosphate reductase